MKIETLCGKNVSFSKQSTALSMKINSTQFSKREKIRNSVNTRYSGLFENRIIPLALKTHYIA